MAAPGYAYGYDTGPSYVAPPVYGYYGGGYVGVPAYGYGGYGVNQSPHFLGAMRRLWPQQPAV